MRWDLVSGFHSHTTHNPHFECYHWMDSAAAVRRRANNQLNRSAEKPHHMGPVYHQLLLRRLVNGLNDEVNILVLFNFSSVEPDILYGGWLWICRESRDCIPCC